MVINIIYIDVSCVDKINIYKYFYGDKNVRISVLGLSGCKIVLKNLYYIYNVNTLSIIYLVT